MYNCADCVKLKAVLNPEVMFEDEFVGTNGHQIHIIYTFSNDATRAVLASFGLEGKFTPVLKVYNGEILEDVESIIKYLEDNGFASPAP